MFADSMWVGLLNQMSSSAPSFPNLPFPFFLDIYFAHFIQPFLFHLITNCQFHFCTAYGLICQDRYQCNLRPPLLSSPPPLSLFSSLQISSFSSYVFLRAYVALHFAICTALCGKACLFKNKPQ